MSCFEKPSGKVSASAAIEGGITTYTASLPT
jgi:hypothetical protein